MDLNRRRLLVSGSTAALALSAGCVADGIDPSAGGDDDGEDADDGSEDDGNGESDGADEEGNGTDGNDTEPEGGDENGTVNDEEEGEGESREDDADADSGEYAIVDRETVQFSGSGETRAEALYSATAVEDALDGQRVPDEASSAIDDLVEGTDFDRSVVLLVGAQAPNLCYGIELQDLGVDEGELTARAAAVDESDPDEACAQSIHTPTMLVRVVFEDAVPQSGSINVTDGWGNGHGSGYGRGSDSASADS